MQTIPKLSVTYPATPESIDQRILDPSPSFKREALKVLAAILFFIFVYLTLIITALGLATLCAIGGFALVVLKPTFITLMLGIGIAGLGVMVVFFLLKFLFKRHKVDRSGLTEIKEEDHPRLFEFIGALAKETQTPFPKKIYLSPDVNASVFYDSSFLSMFFPVSKNLQIGLGLVNAVNLSEFKAVIAHEFGHFSQRSMKLGSYVYNMNQIIFNLLYDNESYENMLDRWANASGYFTFFAILTIRIVKGIQWILQHVYSVVNKQYMGLSRQMEFHADAVAACVSGGNHLIASLRRLEVADTTYNNVFEFYRENYKESLKPQNIYPQHKEIMRVFSTFHGVPFEHGLPQINTDSLKRFNRSRITIRDQWASHPSTDDREAHLRSLNILTPSCNDSAWIIFDDHDALQKTVTENIFGNIQFEGQVKVIDDYAFRQRYHEDIARYRLPAMYKGFFDNRLITQCDVRHIEQDAKHYENLESLLSEEVLALPYRKVGLTSDLETLAAIIDGRLEVKTFEFDGSRFKGEDAQALHSALQAELTEVEKSLAAADREVIAWFMKQCDEVDREKIRSRYSELFILSEQTENDMAVYAAMSEKLIPLYQTMTLQQIEKAVAELKDKEIEFKKQFERVLHNSVNAGFVEADQEKTALEYLSRDWEYFTAQTYVQASLDRLNACLYLYIKVLNERAFQAKASILREQLALAGMTETEAQGVNRVIV